MSCQDVCCVAQVYDLPLAIFGPQKKVGWKQSPKKEKHVHSLKLIWPQKIGHRQNHPFSGAMFFSGRVFWNFKDQPQRPSPRPRELEVTTKQNVMEETAMKRSPTSLKIHLPGGYHFGGCSSPLVHSFSSVATLRNFEWFRPSQQKPCRI